MFKKLFKKNTESTTNTRKVIVPCDCDNGNEHCDLILQLRNCQDLKKTISNEIEILEKDSYELLVNFTNFLYELENRGLLIGRVGHMERHMTSDRNIGVIKWVISECSSADIFRITEELKTYKNKDDIICEKQRALKAVEDEIKNIKTKLGIE